MELRGKIEEALKNAIRNKSENAKDALRMLITALKFKEKEIKRQEKEKKGKEQNKGNDLTLGM